MGAALRLLVTHSGHLSDYGVQKVCVPKIRDLHTVRECFGGDSDPFRTLFVHLDGGYLGRPAQSENRPGRVARDGG